MAPASSYNSKRRAPMPISEETNKRSKMYKEPSGTVAPSSLSTAPGNRSLTFSSENAPQQPTHSAGINMSSLSSWPLYGPTYRSSAVHVQAHGLARLPRSGLQIGNVPFERVNLAIPPNLSPEEQRALKIRWERELKLQGENPPALPPSRIRPLPPKEVAGEYKEIPDGITEEEKEEIRQYNNRISERIQRIDRERNNQAAKKSRETRLEALNLTRGKLHDASAEKVWLRLKLIELGGDPEEWDQMDPGAKGRIVEVIDQRVKESDQKIAEEKKREEARKRAERTKMKAATREMTSPSPASQPRMGNSPS